MAAVFVQIDKGGFSTSSASLSVTLNSAVTAGNFVIVAGSFDAATTGVTVSDGKGGTVTDSGVGLHTSATLKSFIVAFFSPGAAAITFTATFSGTNPTFGDLTVWEISGLTNPTFDKVVVADGNAATADSGSTGTLTSATEAAIAYGCTANTFNNVAGSGWTIGQGSTVGTNVGDGLIAATGSYGEHRVIAATTAINGTGPINSPPANWSMWCATVMAGAAAGPTVQDDWPGPKRVPDRGNAEARRADIRLLHSVKPPIYQYSWPPPIQPPRVYALVQRADIRLLHSVKPPNYRTDWPLPIQPPLVYAQSYGMRRTVLGPDVVTAPFSQDVWPVPLTIIFNYRQDNTWAVNPSPSLLAPISTPAQFDYRLLPLNINFVQAQSVSLNLNLIPAPPAGTSLPGQYDYPLPPQAKYVIVAQVSPLNLSMIAKPPVSLAWPNPVVLTFKPDTNWTLNPSRALLASVVSKPIGQTNWPTPVAPVVRLDTSWQANNPSDALLTPAPAAVMPGQYDYPLPPLARYTITALSNPSLALVSVKPPPPSPNLWPRPLVWAFKQDTNWAVNPSVALLSAQPKPPAPNFWAQPFVSTFKQDTNWIANPSEALLSAAPVVTMPGQYDYPLPPRTVTVFAQSYSSSYALTTVVKPIAQLDWPAPKKLPYFTYSETRGAYLPLLNSVYPPINQEIWPVPIQPARVYAQSTGIPGVALTPAVPPISQDDWPVPKQPGRVYAEARRADIRLLHSVKPPNSQVDWPNPKLPVQPTSARTWIQSVNQLLIPTPPQRQNDWPNPWLGQTTKVRSQSYSSPVALLSAPAAKPFSQSDWPVPQLSAYIGLYFDASRRGWLQRSLFTAPIVITPEHFASDNQFYIPAFMNPVPEPTYDYPIGHSLKSDYGRRLQKSKLISGARKGRFIRGTPKGTR